jgi:hypothetical protein
MVQVENAEFWQLSEDMFQRDGDNLGCSNEHAMSGVFVEDKCCVALDCCAVTHERVLQDGDEFQESAFRYVLVTMTCKMYIY